MNTLSRILAVAVSFGLVIFILRLITNKKLKEKYAILWLVSGSIIFILGVFNNFLIYITGLIGITLPINTVLFFGIFFLIVINIHFSIVISNLCEQNKKIAQKMALLETKIKELSNSI